MTQIRHDLTERLRHLLALLFRSHLREMAREVGISHSTLSLILSGQRRPGSKVLKAIGRHPRVNEAWLLRGEGEPLLPVLAGTLPVANVLLPGSPAEHASLLSGERYPAADLMQRETRYWLRLSGTSSPVCRPSLGMQPGDLLLVETARDHLDRQDLVVSRLCAVRISTTPPLYEFAGISQDGRYTVASPLGSLSEPTRQLSLDEMSVRRPPKISRKKKRGESAKEESAQGIKETANSRDSGKIVIEDLSILVGVVIQLTRPQILTNL